MLPVSADPTLIKINRMGKKLHVWAQCLNKAHLNFYILHDQKWKSGHTLRVNKFSFRQNIRKNTKNTSYDHTYVMSSRITFQRKSFGRDINFQTGILIIVI